MNVRGPRERYGGVSAPHGLDLDIHRGEVSGPLGPKGAGRSACVDVLQG
ncbi:hypothetical protein [Streptomyces sp. YIM 132580]